MAITLYDGKRSALSIVVEKYLLLRGTKKVFSTHANTSKYIERIGTQNNQPYVIKGVKFESEIMESHFEGMQYFILNNKESRSQRVILYLHGGAWTNQPFPLHWTFMDQMAQALDAKVIAPIYPKVPHFDHTHTYPRLLKLYREILSTVETPLQITFMGDSAGGNIALSLACQLKNDEMPQPKDIILISACLDMGLTHPHIPEFEKNDPMLSMGGMSAITEIWAGDKSVNDPIISPMYADLKGLASITHFIGTHEGLYPDAIKFDEMVSEQGGKIDTYVYPKMNHVFVLLPLEEAKDARQKIMSRITD